MRNVAFGSVIFILTGLIGVARAADAPHLEGLIETNPAEGLVRGDLCLTRLPQIAKYTFVLNRGLNIREVRDGASGKALPYEGFYDSVGMGDGTRYTLDESVDAAG